MQPLINFFKQVYRLWMKFGALLGTINGFVILTLFYTVIIGLYAIPTRLLKKKSVPMKTYWKMKEKKVETIDSVRYQF